MEDMKQLMTSENGEYFSDFTLCLNGRDIKAHKVCYSALFISDIGKLFEFVMNLCYFEKARIIVTCFLELSFLVDTRKSKIQLYKQCAEIV